MLCVCRSESASQQAEPDSGSVTHVIAVLLLRLTAVRVCRPFRSQSTGPALCLPQQEP